MNPIMLIERTSVTIVIQGESGCTDGVLELRGVGVHSLRGAVGIPRAVGSRCKAAARGRRLLTGGFRAP